MTTPTFQIEWRDRDTNEQGSTPWQRGNIEQAAASANAMRAEHPTRSCWVHTDEAAAGSENTEPEIPFDDIRALVDANWFTEHADFVFQGGRNASDAFARLVRIRNWLDGTNRTPDSFLVGTVSPPVVCMPYFQVVDGPKAE